MVEHRLLSLRCMKLQAQRKILLLAKSDLHRKKHNTSTLNNISPRCRKSHFRWNFTQVSNYKVILSLEAHKSPSPAVVTSRSFTDFKARFKSFSSRAFCNFPFLLYFSFCWCVVVFLDVLLLVDFMMYQNSVVRSKIAW